MAGEDPDYCNWLRSRPCARCGAYGVQVHHRTGAGMALRGHDDKGIPLCHICHGDFHALAGMFKGWSRAGLAHWQDRQISILRKRYESLVEPPF